MDFLKARSAKLKQEESVERQTNELLEKHQELKRVSAEREAFVHNWNNESTQKLVDLHREIESLKKQLEKARRLSELVELRAPARAVVLQMAARSVGSVVEKAETLVTLVPLDDPLVAEVQIPARDIGYVREDDEVRIKLEAFPFQKHGTVQGRIVTISDDAFQKETPQGAIVTYKGKVAITDAALRNVPEDFRLIPGMTLSAEIKVGSRRVIDYFIYPIIRSLDESIREP